MNKLLKSALSLLMALMLVFSLGTSAFANNWDLTNGDITVTATVGQEQMVSQGETHTADNAPTITGGSAESSTASSITIVSNDGATANVTLDNVHIDTSSTTGGGAAISVTGSGDTNIELDGNNSVTSADKHAGIEKNGSDTGTLTIKDESGTSGTLTATGGRGAAGIGGGTSQSGENITISGGNVTANAGDRAAGIGGGVSNSGNNITISGGNVNATGKGHGAGIGGGDQHNGTNITITDGTVTATGGENGGAGIGGGHSGDGTSITIKGGTVNATGGEIGGAGIGGGRSGDGTNITIKGGNVTAKGGSGSYIDQGDEQYGFSLCYVGGAAGIGGGAGESEPNDTNTNNADNINITGGTVNATGGSGAPAIGSGASGMYAIDADEVVILTNEDWYSTGECKSITITGDAQVTATAGKSFSVNGTTILAEGTAIGNGSTAKTGTAVTPTTTDLTGYIILNDADGKVVGTIGNAPTQPSDDDPTKPDEPTKPTEPTNPTKPSDDTSSKVESTSSASSAGEIPAVTPVPARYSVTKGDKQTWLSTGADALTFTLSDDNVIKVLIDGEEVTFELKNGEIVIPAEVLQTLESGEHEIEFVFSDGSCKAVFTIE